MSLVVLALTHFHVRFYLEWRGVELRYNSLWRILPHTNDSMLLFSELVIAWLSRQYPSVTNWLTLKLFLLIAYIILGSLTLRKTLSKRKRMISGVVGVITYFLILGAACTSPRCLSAKLKSLS